MAQYLPIRAFNRSQQVRIGKQKVLPTATTFIDIDDPVQRKEFGHHSSIGSVYVVGPLSASDVDVAVDFGASVNEGSSSSDLKLDITAGQLRNRQTGVITEVAAKADAVTLAAADGTKDRIDIVQIKTADGTVTKKDGTAATTPVAPSPDAGNIAVAQVLVEKTVTGIANSKITDVRKFA